MARGVPSLTITVVPGLGHRRAGRAWRARMTIKIDDGKHSYELDYTLAESP